MGSEMCIRDSRHVTVHVDCDVTMTSPWRRRVANGNGDGEDAQTVESSIVLSIGKAFIESSRYPRFEVSSPLCHMQTDAVVTFLPCDYAKHIRTVLLSTSVCLSVRPSVCQTRVL